MKAEIRKILEKHTFTVVSRIESGKVLKMPMLVEGKGSFDFDPKKHACVEYAYPKWVEMLDELDGLFQSELEKVSKKSKGDAIAFADYCVFNGYGREFIRLAYDRFLTKN